MIQEAMGGGIYRILNGKARVPLRSMQVKPNGKIGGGCYILSCTECNGLLAFHSFPVA